MSEQNRARGVSPVVGGVLLLGITVLIVAIAGYGILGAGDTDDPAPAVALTLEQTENPAVYRLSYESGTTALGERTELQGVADETVLHDRGFVAGAEAEVVPLRSNLRLVWYGEEQSYTLRTFSVDPVLGNTSVSGIDHGCAWAEARINDQGDLDLSNGVVLRCDITDGVDLDDGVNSISLDFDTDAVLVGSVDTDSNVDIDSATVTGDITTTTAANDITVTGESTVYGDVVAPPDTNIDIDGGSEVGGAVVARDGTLTLDGVTVDGHVYVDSDDFTCSSDTTIGPEGLSCGEYSPRDPEDY